MLSSIRLLTKWLVSYKKHLYTFFFLKEATFLPEPQFVQFFSKIEAEIFFRYFKFLMKITLVKRVSLPFLILETRIQIPSFRDHSLFMPLVGAEKKQVG